MDFWAIFGGTIWLILTIGFVITEGKRSPLGIIGSIIACLLITPIGAVILVHFIILK